MNRQNSTDFTQESRPLRELLYAGPRPSSQTWPVAVRETGTRLERAVQCQSGYPPVLVKQSPWECETADRDASGRENDEEERQLPVNLRLRGRESRLPAAAGDDL
jgi:hypothetical protein